MTAPSPSGVSATDSAGIHPTADEAIDWFRKMSLIRRFEERAEEAYGQGKVGGFLHLYSGEEAVAVGAVAALHPEDDVCPRTVPTGGVVDTYPDGKIVDKGCGAKLPDKTFGGPVLVDVRSD